MSRLFISHSSQDDAWALVLKDWLVREGWSESDVFLDLEQAAIADPAPRRQQALARCEALLVLVSKAWVVAEPYEKESRFAHESGKTLVLLLIDGISHDDLPDVLTTRPSLRFDGEPSQPVFAIHPRTRRQYTVHIAVGAFGSLKHELEDAGIEPGASDSLLFSLRRIPTDLVPAELKGERPSADMARERPPFELSIDDLLRLTPPRRRASFEASAAPAPPPPDPFPSPSYEPPSSSAVEPAPPPPPDWVAAHIGESFPMPVPEACASPPPPPQASAPRAPSGANKLLLGAVGAIGALLLAGLALYLARRGLRDHLGWLGGGLVHPAVLPPPPPAASRQDSIVDLSVFAPPHIMPTFLVQVFVHDTDEDESRVAAMAAGADPLASRRGVATLDIEIAYGETLDITLEGPGLTIEDARQTIVWRGKPRACAFVVSASPFLVSESVVLRVRAYREAIPVGQVTFTMRRVAMPASAEMAPVGDLARHYRRAFLSYASVDRGEVVKRAQALRAGRVDFFHDLLSLEPGEHWERRLYAEIERCDLFILFWSRAARASPWVAKEIAYALALQAEAGGDGRPEILPILLEGPPPAEPPDTLAYLHFHDPFLYVIADAEQRSSRLGS